METIRIPHERVAAIIGKGGRVKKLLEEKCKVKIKVSGEGYVEIEGKNEDEFFAKDVIKAIGRGFSYEDAIKILNENYSFELINLKEFCRNENDLRRVRGRIIGEKGRVKKAIENSTETKISVYGWTIGVIGPMDSISYALKAIEKIIRGAKHSTIFKDLANYRREIFGRRLLGKSF